MRAIKSLLVSLGFLLALAAAVAAQDLPTARPAEVGLSAERLDRITAMLKADVDKGIIPARSCWCARHGKIACSTRSACAIRRPRRR